MKARGGPDSCPRRPHQVRKSRLTKEPRISVEQPLRSQVLSPNVRTHHPPCQRRNAEAPILKVLALYGPLRTGNHRNKLSFRENKIPQERQDSQDNQQHVHKPRRPQTGGQKHAITVIVRCRQSSIESLTFRTSPSHLGGGHAT